MANYNSNTVDEPVKVEEASRHDGDSVYIHPSYGMIGVSRRSGNSGVPLFGAKTPSDASIVIKISEGEETQTLGKNWYSSRKTLTSVEMTPVQYAELITNPNCSGVPCTIKYTSDKGHIKYRPHATEVEYLEVKINEELNNLKTNLAKKKTRVKEILSQKGALKKADKDELMALMNNIDVDMQSNIPFYKQCMAESVERMVVEAKCDVESMTMNVQNRLGKALLEKPELISLMLESNNVTR